MYRIQNKKKYIKTEFKKGGSVSWSMFYHLEILNRNLCNYVFESPDKTAFT